MDVDYLIKMLQASIAPSVLLSGFGLLLLSMTNRLGRAVDRTRSLNAQLKLGDEREKSHLLQQVSILLRRCEYLRLAIGMITLSVFFVALLILMMFSTYTLGVNLKLIVQGTFVASLLCLIVSLLYFLLDIRLTLASIKIEIDGV